MAEELVHDLTYICGPVAQRFHKDITSRVKLLLGPFGTGKTSSCAFDLVEKQSRRVLPTLGKKRSRFAVVRNTYPELRDTTIRSYLDWFPPMFFGKYNATEKRYFINIEDREIELIFKALDSPDDVRDLLSLELTGAHVDEAREVHQDIIKGLLGRIGRFPSMKDTGGRNPFVDENGIDCPPQVDLSTNYPSTTHWLYGDFVSKRIDGYTLYEQGQSENKHNLRPGYYEDLEKDYANRPDLLRTLVRGEWGITVKGKQVFPEFVRKHHVADCSLIPDQAVKVLRGWDNTGLSPAIHLGYIAASGQWRIFKEFCWEDTGIMEAADEMILWCNQNLHKKCTYRDIADPAGNTRDSTKQSPADYIRTVGKERGVQITLEDGIQTFKIRRESVAGRLTKLINKGEPALLIDPSCTMLIDGLDGGYAYPELGGGGFKTDPAKNEYSHIVDSVEYVATVLFRYIKAGIKKVVRGGSARSRLAG